MESGSQEARKGIIWNSGTQAGNGDEHCCSPRSQSPDWERTCLRNSVSTSIALLFASALSAHAQIALPQQQQPVPSPTQELAPIAPPVPVFPYPMWMVVSVGGGVLLVVGTIIWAVMRHIKNRPLPPPPTPRELALASLEALRERITQLEPLAGTLVPQR